MVVQTVFSEPSVSDLVPFSGTKSHLIACVVYFDSCSFPWDYFRVGSRMTTFCRLIKAKYGSESLDQSHLSSQF